MYELLETTFDYGDEEAIDLIIEVRELVDIEGE